MADLLTLQKIFECYMGEALAAPIVQRKVSLRIVLPTSSPSAITASQGVALTSSCRMHDVQQSDLKAHAAASLYALGICSAQCRAPV